MKKLYEILGQAFKKGDVGIEIEVEGQHLPDNVDPRWNATVDGSLRGENREYVLRQPLSVADARNALECLAQNMKDAKAKMAFSFRTSVHVHVNCQDLTYAQYLNFLYTYFLLEEPLMTFCGKERKGNRFCLRLQDAEGMLETYQKMFTQWEEGFHHIPPNQVRYSAMNIEATAKYGSLEFRGMRGNMDVDLISTWVNALIYLREFAKSVDNPSKVYELYANLEAQGFMDHVLKELSPRFYYARVAKDVQRSFSLSIDLPFAYGEMAKKLEQQKKRDQERKERIVDMEVNHDPWAMPNPALAEIIRRQQEVAQELRAPGRIFANAAVPAAPRPAAPRRPVAPRPVRREEF